MLFSVIYSVDVPSDTKASDFAPPNLDELWDQTEGDDQYEFSYLEGCWENGSHRKWCALLTRDQFDEFVNHCGLHAEDVQTMGSLGSPGFDYGWSPAISFTSDSQQAIQSAYVTPIPKVERKRGKENDWDRVRDAVHAVYS